jgi:hypothetical protein
VKTIIISAPHVPPQQVGGLQWGQHLEAAQQELKLGLQWATYPPPSPSAAAAAEAEAAATAAAAESTAAAHHLHQQQLPLRWPSISSITMAGNAGMLAALPHSLTHLDLKVLQWPEYDPNVSTALARLSNLQHLYLHNSESFSGGCLAQLTRLTLLELDCGVMSEQMLQQLLTTSLSLRVLRLFGAFKCQVLDLSELVQLQEYRNDNASAKTTFPPQLQQLLMGAVSCEQDFESILQLQQLRHLDVVNGVAKPELLLRLAELPALQSLSLQYCENEAAAATAAAWPQLPQLHELLFVVDKQFSRTGWQAICTGPAASASLTKLVVDVAPWQDDEAEEEGSAQDDAQHEHVHHHHHVTQSSHSINAIGPAPLWSGRKREHCCIMFATITHIPSLHKILSNTPA